MTATLDVPTVATPGEVLPRLLAIAPGRDRIVSCYARVGPDDRTNQRYLAEVKDRSAAILDGRALRRVPREVRQQVERDLERIRVLLARPANLPRARGLAVFASEPMGLFELVPLPRVHRTRVIVDRTAAVRELSALEEALRRVIVLVLDRAHARFFLATPLDIEELASMAPVSTRGGKFHSDRHGAPGVGEATYHNRIRTERERHYDAVARHLRVLMGTHAADGIALAGRERDTEAVRRFLAPELARRIWATERLNPTAVAMTRLAALADAARDAHDRAADRAAMTQFAEGIGTGWSTVGARQTLRALARGQARTLLVAADVEGGGYRCSRTGLLVLAPEDCAGQGVPLDVPDIVDDAIEEALRQGIDVRTIENQEDAALLEGLSAVLRFR